MMTDQCPCGTAKPLADCCGPYMNGTAVAPTPEALMRSRFSAYALGGYGEYLLQTWHPATAAGLSAATLNQQDVEWLSLEVKSSHVDGDTGTVDFVATSRSATGLEHMHELSSFSRVAGRWLYVGGEVAQTRADVGRNDTCPCGSGKKYKKCCL